MDWHWKVVGCRVAGPSHLSLGIPCQDSFRIDVVGGEHLVAVVSDGAGSARFAAAGSYIISEAVVACLARDIGVEKRLPLDIRPAVERAIVAARATIEDRMAEFGDGLLLRDFHATLVGCIADAAGGWFFHIGDGAACAVPAEAGGNEPRWDGALVSQPANGEYANETYFATADDWARNLRIVRFEAAEVILLMSDGVTPFAMAAACRCPEARFMSPVDRCLQMATQEEAEQRLAATLDASRARRISGDDKTLVWARRVHGTAP